MENYQLTKQQANERVNHVLTASSRQIGVFKGTAVFLRDVIECGFKIIIIASGGDHNIFSRACNKQNSEVDLCETNVY